MEGLRKEAMLMLADHVRISEFEVPVDLGGRGLLRGGTLDLKGSSWMKGS
jgi:hypothetical protein